MRLASPFRICPWLLLSLFILRLVFSPWKFFKKCGGTGRAVGAIVGKPLCQPDQLAPSLRTKNVRDDWRFSSLSRRRKMNPSGQTYPQSRSRPARLFAKEPTGTAVRFTAVRMETAPGTNARSSWFTVRLEKPLSARRTCGKFVVKPTPLQSTGDYCLPV